MLTYCFSDDSDSMSMDDVVEQQQQQQTFETPEFMSEWTDKQKSGKLAYVLYQTTILII